jgi:hypothetical protein
MTASVAMASPEVRSDPLTMDASWMTSVLESAGVAKGAAVTHVGFGGYIGTGQTGRNGRLHLTWDNPNGRPASLVAKFPSGDKHARTQAFGNGTYRKEWVFYDQVARTVGIRTPICHFAGYDEAKPDFVLLLEDLSESRQGDQLDGLSVDQVSAAIPQAVALHAPRWGDPTIDTIFTNGEVITPEDAVTRTQFIYDATLPGFLQRIGHRLDPDVVELAQQFGEVVGKWSLGTGTPRTLVHFDFRADNLLFGHTPAAPPVVVVDWQTVNVGVGACDMAYLVSGSFPDFDVRRSVERDLVEEYRKQLGAAGIDQRADEAWRDYRYGSLWGMIITVIAVVLAEQTERGDDMFVAMAQRHGRQAIDLQALDLLR